MNAALPVAVDSEPPPKVTGRVGEQQRRDFGQEFESALNEADAGKEKSLPEAADAPEEGGLPDGLRGLAGQPGDDAPKANPAAGPMASKVPDGNAPADAARNWNAASSMRLASLLSSELGRLPRSGQATSPAMAGAAGGPTLEAAPDALPKTRIGVVAMATHFEPTARDPRLVAGETGNAAIADASAPVSAVLPGAPVSAARQNASASPALRELAAGPIGAVLAGSPERRTGSERHLTTGRNGQESERFATRGEAHRSAAPLATGTAAGNSAGEGSQSDMLATGTPFQVPPIEASAAFASVSGQVAERVATALAPLAHYPSSFSQADSTLRYRAGGAALKSIQIQLQPENLGTVDVSMRLINGELAVELVTSEADTARILAEDNKALKALLEKAGFSLDEAAISILARDHASARPGQASQIIHSDGQGGFGQARQDGSSAEGNPERRSQPGREESARQPAGDAGEAAPLRSGQGPSIYI